jgi:hypothetical protein
MGVRRWSALCFSAPLLLAFTLVSAPVTALAQGFQSAGNYANTGMLGSFNYSDPATNTNISVFAIRQRSVGPAGTTDETQIFLNVSVGFGTLNVNCSLDDNSGDFNVAPDLSSASLHKTVAMDNPGCGGSLTSDIVVDISWTGAGPVQSTHIASRFLCSGYTAESQGSDSNNAGPATFDITGLGGPITAPDPQVFHFGSSLAHVQGAVPPDTCHGSLGKGAGRPTPAAGDYQTTFQDASVSSFSNGFFFLDANRTTSASNPLVGPSTSSAQTQVNFSTGAVGGCFLINSGDFTLGASSASLHTVLTSDTSTCNGEPNFVQPGDTFPIDAQWAGTSPVATTGVNSQYSCLSYRFQTSVAQSVDSVATVTVSMPGMSGVIPDPGNLGSIDTRTHADGTAATGCTFRG